MAHLCRNGNLLGPYIFHRNNNGYIYLQIINNFTFPKLQKCFNNQFKASFSICGHDGAPPHCLRAVRYRLHEMLANAEVASKIS